MGFMGFNPTDLPQDDDQRQAPPQIGRPQAVSATPPLTLRGVTPPAPSAPPDPAEASINDLEQNADKSRNMEIPALRQTMQPPPGDAHLAADEAQRANLDKGSGISQFSQNHHILGPILRGLSVAGSIVAPGAAMMIPGTDLHHQMLVNQNRNAINSDLEQQEKQTQTAGQQATTEHTQAETGAIPAETKLKEAQTSALQHPEPKPKEENWADFTGWTDKDGTPLLREANSGQVVRADNKQPPAGFQQAKPGKPDTPEQQFYDSAEEQGKTQTQKTQDWARASQRPEQPQKPQQQLVVGKDGKVVELHPGDQIPEGAQSIQSLEKSSQAGEASQAAMNYANDYMAGKQFTGAGDEALMEKYFELAKPSSGFRMTQPQIEMLTKAQDIMNSVVAKGKHLFSPNAPYFSPDLRQQIVQTMNTLQHAKAEKPATQGGGSGGGFQAPAGAPPAPQQDGHKLKMNGNVIAISKGGAWVAPPANSK